MKSTLYRSHDSDVYYWLGADGVHRTTAEEIENMSTKFEYGGFLGGFGPITGKRADTIIIDDPAADLKLTPQQMEYAKNASMRYFLKHNPTEFINTRFPLMSAIEKVDENSEFDGFGRPLPSKPYYTCAVRYLRGPNIGKSYTYRVKKGAKLHLGQEVVVPTTQDGFTALTVAVVVEIHRSKQDNGPYDYKFVAGTVKPL